MKKQHIVIIGSGLAGSLLAIYQAQKGFRVSVYERRPDMRKEHISAGRSINMALSNRGIYALQEVGLDETVLRKAIPMKGRMIHSTRGDLTFQPYGREEHEVINSISRRGLNCMLMDAAEGYENVTIFFNERCIAMDFQSGEVLLRNERNGETLSVIPDTVIACDGATSAVRMEMQKAGRFNFSQTYLEHGYKELAIPPGEKGVFQLEKHALHIWPRETYMLIALPNPDGSFTGTLFFPFEGELSFESLGTRKKVRQFFQEQFPDALPLMPALQEDFFNNPISSLITVRCHPWYVQDKTLLLGDAAHAIVPFYGQGMNCAFEDCSVLNQCIEEYGTDWERVYREFTAQRKENTDAIADLALENFIEMRNKVADPAFLRKKKIELLLEEKYPGRFYSKYAMVTFHRVPYAVALKKGRIQDQILMELCRSVDSPEDLDLEKVFFLIQKELKKAALS